MTVIAVRAVPVVEAYDLRQPRDDRGRFASGTGQPRGGYQGGAGDSHVSGAGIQRRIDRAQQARDQSRPRAATGGVSK